MVCEARDEAELEAVVAHELMMARRVHAGNRNLNRIKSVAKAADLRVFNLHAPHVESIGNGTALKPYELGVKVFVATTFNRSKGGLFVTRIQALPGKPYEDHTLETTIPAMPRSGQRFPASSPMPDTRATTLRKPIALRFIPQARNAA